MGDGQADTGVDRMRPKFDALALLYKFQASRGCDAILEPRWMRQPIPMRSMVSLSIARHDRDLLATT